MKKFILLVISILFFYSSANCATFQGNVSKVDQVGSHQIVDADSMNPIDGATINIPQKNFSTKSDANGKFSLDANISGDTIMSVSKDGYKPFSLTVNESIASRPMTVGIEKTAPMDLTIDTNMFHLGDNNFSDTSANAGEFKVQAIGPYYSKKFLIKNTNENTYLVIGSIIGIDTKMAQSVGQNSIAFAYASPPEIYFNGTKIAEIQLNGDGQRFKIPRTLIKVNQQNEVTIKTGRNMMQTAYIDYDDIEFMNLSIESN